MESEVYQIPSDDSRYIPAEVKRIVWTRDHGRCVICGSNRKLHWDHDIPFRKGGSNSEKNIRILCEKCNLQKSDKIE
jgi:5-methylcytosine-specific restriction endonuclease McrA